MMVNSLDDPEDLRWRRRQKRRIRPGFGHEKALIFGVIQLLCGCAAIILAVVSIATQAWGYSYGSGFWSGGFFLTAGIFGLASSRRKTNVSIVSYMVFSAISAMLALVLLTLAAIGVSSDHTLFHSLQMSQGSALVVQSLHIVVAAVEAVCGTAASILGCKAVCGAWYSPESSVYESAAPGLGDIGGLSVYDPTQDPTSAFPQRPNALNPVTQGPSASTVTGPTIVSGESLDPQQIQFPFQHSSSGQQQIAIVAPMGAEPSSLNLPQGAYFMQTAGVPGSFSQVMYIMPPAPPCVQPGCNQETDFRPPGTPPPSYSTLELDRIGLDEESENNDVSGEGEAMLSLLGTRENNDLEYQMQIATGSPRSQDVHQPPPMYNRELQLGAMVPSVRASIPIDPLLPSTSTPPTTHPRWRQRQERQESPSTSRLAGLRPPPPPRTNRTPEVHTTTQEPRTRRTNHTQTSRNSSSSSHRTVTVPPQGRTSHSQRVHGRREQRSTTNSSSQTGVQLPSRRSPMSTVL